MTVWEKLYKDRESKDGVVRVMQDLKNQIEESNVTQLQSTTKKLLSQSKKPSEFYLQQAAMRREARLSTYLKASTPAFRPRILRSSRKIASARPDSRQEVFERLYSARLSESTRQPEFDATKNMRPPTIDRNELSFLERQRIDADTRKWKGHIRSELLQRRCSFTPRLSTKSENIAVNRGRDADIVRRLAVDDIRARNENHAQRVMDADPQCRFVPEINSYSDAIASMKRVSENCSVHEKLYFQRTPSHMNKAPRSEIAELVPKPQRPKSAYNHVRSHYNLRDPDLTLVVIDNARREREEIRTELLRNREERELSECTFQPKVNKYRGDRGGPILVAGLDKFVTSRDQGRRMSEIGRVPSFREYDSPTHAGVLTIPQPFTLSGISD